MKQFASLGLSDNYGRPIGFGFSFLLFFLAYSWWSQSGYLPYFHKWCSLSANLDAGLKYGARGSLKIQNAKIMQKIAICAPSHNFVGLYLHN